MFPFLGLPDRITFIGAQENQFPATQTSASPFTCTAPSGIRTGDLLIFVFRDWQQMFNYGYTITPPAGVSQIIQAPFVQFNQAGRLVGGIHTELGLTIFSRIVTSSEPSTYDFTIAPPTILGPPLTMDCGFTVLCFRNASKVISSPINYWNDLTANNPLNHTTGGIVENNRGGVLLIATSCSGDGSGVVNTVSTPAGFTLISTSTLPATYGSGLVNFYYKESNSNGPLGTFTVTFTRTSGATTQYGQSFCMNIV